RIGCNESAKRVQPLDQRTNCDEPFHPAISLSQDLTEPAQKHYSSRVSKLYDTHDDWIFEGFVEVKAACCGLGNLNADVPCIPISAILSQKGRIMCSGSLPSNEA
ncbi:hypothetical protein IFM89_029908, partial [Coptis chinensis]